jgi:hypothetical protein
MMSVASYGFCSTCGTPRTTSDSVFCHKCGAAQQADAPAPAAAYAPPLGAPRTVPVASTASSFAQPAATTYGQTAATTYGQTATSTGLNYARNKKYFTGSAGLGIVLIIIGICTIMVVIGIFFIIAGILVLANSGGASQQELDGLVAAEGERVRAKAMQKLNLDEDEVGQAEPIVAWGYNFETHAGDPILSKKGTDGRWRTSWGEAMIILFSADVLHYYKYVFPLTQQIKPSESTDEYFYRDVVSVATASETVDLHKPGAVKPLYENVETLSLTTSGGTRVKCSIWGDTDSMGRSIQGARSLIKDKKKSPAIG